MKPRSDPAKLRELAHMLRRLDDVNRDELIKQLEDAATDIEVMAEDLDMERECMCEMVGELAIRNPPKALK